MARLAFFVILVFTLTSYAQNATQSVGSASFGQDVPVPGSMARDNITLEDGMRIVITSPRPRTVVVEKNKTPIDGKLVTGTEGEPFFALSDYSYIVKLNETANDLIADIELPYTAVLLSEKSLDDSNTYVGTLAPDGRSWLVDEEKRTVDLGENRTRLMKLTSVDGEYILLGRKTDASANLFLEFGDGPEKAFNVTGDNLSKEAEYEDGLRLKVQSEDALAINANIKLGLTPESLPTSTKSLNAYFWVINTTDKNAKLMTNITFPVNAALLRDFLISTTSMSSQSDQSANLNIAARPLGSNELFEAFTDKMQHHDVDDGNIELTGLTQLDGEYIVMVAKSVNSTNKDATSGSSSRCTMIASSWLVGAGMTVLIRLL